MRAALISTTAIFLFALTLRAGLAAAERPATTPAAPPMPIQTPVPAESDPVMAGSVAGAISSSEEAYGSMTVFRAPY
jgi:hypothetical protein